MNRYAPPTVEVADIEAASTDRPKLFKTSGIALAALLGGALAAGYLVYRNLNSLDRPRNAKRAALAFALCSVAFLVVAWGTPADFISQLLSAVLPQLIVVLWVKWWFQPKKLQGPRPALFRSNWIAAGIGVAGNLATTALFFLLALFTAGLSA